jgi:phosphatidylglycerophosphate synthase
MKIHTSDVLTPANAITLVGLGMSLYGAYNLDTLSGTLIFGAGKSLDMLDGPVARRTHASDFGAAFDATADKIAIGAALVASVIHESAPLPVIGFIAAQNITNTVFTLAAEKRGLQPKTSWEGKRAMFGQGLAIGGFALAHALNNEAVDVASWGVFAASVPLSLKATWGYIQRVRQNH